MLYGMSTRVSWTSPDALGQGHERAAHWTLERALIGGGRLALRGRKQGSPPFLDSTPKATLQLQDGPWPTSRTWRKSLELRLPVHIPEISLAGRCVAINDDASHLNVALGVD